MFDVNKIDLAVQTTDTNTAFSLIWSLCPQQWLCCNEWRGNQDIIRAFTLCQVQVPIILSNVQTNILVQQNEGLGLGLTVNNKGLQIISNQSELSIFQTSFRELGNTQAIIT